MTKFSHYVLRDEASDGGASGGDGGTTTATTDKPATGTPEAATDDKTSDAEAALGDAGKKALREERKARQEAERRAQTAEREAEELRSKTQTEQEKAINEAKKAGAVEERTKWEGLIRRTRVEQALATAGCIDPELASLAPDFADLKVSETGSVDGMDSVIESFKAAHPRQFAATAPGGSADQGVKPVNNNQRPASLEEAVTAALSGQKGR